MQFLDLTLETPEENLALDEALLNDAECAALAGHDSPEQFETLRIWESPSPVVVVGSSTRVADEVKLDVCRAEGVPVLRRVSGGTTIVAGPGCLMYAVVLSYTLRPALRSLDAAHSFVLNSITAELNQRVENSMVVRAGTSDLAIGTRKFSGNALRCRRHFLLYHGTVLYDFPLAMISRYQHLPARQPKYRERRGHDEFVMNLPLGREFIESAFENAFHAKEVFSDWPRQTTSRLAAEKYRQSEWNERL